MRKQSFISGLLTTTALVLGVFIFTFAFGEQVADVLIWIIRLAGIAYILFVLFTGYGLKIFSKKYSFVFYSLGCLLGLLISGTILVILSNNGILKPPSKDQPEQTNNINSSEPFTLSFTVSSESLVGLWQDAPSLGSGWGNLYEFYPYGKYKFIVSTMNCQSREQEIIGTWEYKNNKLFLTEKERKILVGGKDQPASGSCATEREIVDAKAQTLKLSNPISKSLSIERYTKEMAETENNKNFVDYYPAIILEGINREIFFKYSDNPDHTQYGK